MDSISPRLIRFEYRQSDLWQKKVSAQVSVFIVGGGPAGLQAAWTATRRGIAVKAFEKDSDTGGCLKIGRRPPFKEDIGLFARKTF